MNKRICRLLMAAQAVVMCLSMFSGGALAADVQTVQIPVQIEQAGELIEPGDSYTIELRSGEADAPMPEGSVNGVYDVQITGAGEAVIDIDYTDLGVYTYTLYQVAGEKENCEYDDAVYQLTVYVTVDENNVRETTAVLYSNGKKQDGAVFVNTYKAGDPATVDPAVEKAVSVTSGTAPEDTEFAFTLKAETEGAPMPDGASGSSVTVKRTGAGAVEFGSISFDASCVGNTYVYTLSEVQGDAEGYTYDAQAYQMTVTVTAKDGQISAAVSYRNEKGEQVDAATFTNTYKEPVAPTPSPSPSPKPTELPKTGQLWWPVGLLAVIGALFVLGGVLVKRKKA